MVLALAGSFPAHAASLSDGVVDPDTGTTETKFTYSVTYQGDTRPLAGYVVIDQKRALRLRPEADGDPTQGVMFSRATRLRKDGDHEYRFAFLIRTNGAAADDAGPGGPSGRPDVTRILYPGPTNQDTLSGPTVEAADLVIAGRVKGPDGGVEGIVVSARKPGEAPAAATTNADGHYRIEGLTRGIYSVSAHDPNSPAKFAPKSLRLRVPPSRRGIDFRLLPPPTICGVVRDRHGRPLEGVAMTARLAEAPTDAAPLETTTNAEGKYRFGNPARGIYVVKAALDGYRFSPRARKVKVPPGKCKVNFTGRQLPKGELSEGQVDPEQGSESSLFTYSVTFTHPDDVRPLIVMLVVDQSERVAMRPDAADDDFTDGVTFSAAVDGLLVGEHEYRFWAVYKEGPVAHTLRFPGPGAGDTIAGPTVNSDGD